MTLNKVQVEKGLPTFWMGVPFWGQNHLVWQHQGWAVQS